MAIPSDPASPLDAVKYMIELSESQLVITSDENQALKDYCTSAKIPLLIYHNDLLKNHTP